MFRNLCLDICVREQHSSAEEMNTIKFMIHDSRIKKYRPIMEGKPSNDYRAVYL